MSYDVIIIGGGPAGLSAAVYASRARLKTLLIEKAGCGGQMAVTDLLENYPGFNGGINGFELATKLEAQARDFGTEIIYDEALSIEGEAVKSVKTNNKTYETKTVIIAAGTKAKELGAGGEKQFVGRGVSYCAVCDAPFYKNKEVVVVGGGNSALQEAIYLSKFAKNVTLIHRRNEFRAVKILQERLFSVPNISILYDSTVVKISGNEKVEKLTVENCKTGNKSELKADGLFVFIGLIPNTANFPQLSINKYGYIITDENMKTSVSGIFACGDVRDKMLRQVVTAAADGAQAAISAQHYIENS